MGQGTENQKEVTDKYRSNWDEIFRKTAKEQPIEQEQLELPLTDNTK